MARQVSGLIVCVTVALSGCETATAIKDKAVEAATTAGSFISTQASHAADFVMGRKSGWLVDDGAGYFATTRVPFYAAVDEVTKAQRLEYGAMAGAAIGTFAVFYADSVVAKLAAAGFTATMVAVIVNIEADHERITAVNNTFGALVNCREREAKQINLEYGQRKLNRAVAVDRLDKLRALMAEDVEVAQGVNTILAARNDGYALSTQQVQTKRPPPRAAPTPRIARSRPKRRRPAFRATRRHLPSRPPPSSRPRPSAATTASSSAGGGPHG